MSNFINFVPYLVHLFVVSAIFLFKMLHIVHHSDIYMLTYVSCPNIRNTNFFFTHNTMKASKVRTNKNFIQIPKLNNEIIRMTFLVKYGRAWPI